MTDEPGAFKGVMVSSTFDDLTEHRRAVLDALTAQKLLPIGMDHDSARTIGVIESSLEKVRQASAYIGIISRRYGQVLKDPERNPDGLSLVELEFNEALRLERPRLLFIMGEDHPLTEKDIEKSSKNRRKLEAFRKRASAQCVYKVFNSHPDFAQSVTQSIAELCEVLKQSPEGEPEVRPKPPALYAEPPYIGSHQFVGRQAQLDVLTDWAASADPHPVLLFEAIGGAGKSMLTWEWTTRHAPAVRQDWAGRFWYSFYEKGAVMADFCGRALAYMTGRPFADFRGKRTTELSELLLAQLRNRPWLLILDGLERVLVAYHRIDAAQLADEEAGGSDEIARHRDPCAAIRPEDDELLRSLASASPSKLLLTSRLAPRVLLNTSSQAIPGVLHQQLSGLRPADAEALFRSCGVTGTAQAIQDYLQKHCDCHPLVTGILAGLVNDYLPDPGNFDAWAAAPDGGAALNLAELDLVQKRNHILTAALKALPPKSRQLLSTLALLSEAVDFATLGALNPHLPPEPEEVEEPENPEQYPWWESISEDEKAEGRQDYEIALRRRKEYERAVEERRKSPAFRAAPKKLGSTIRDLQQRGLLQYDAQVKRYDLHPVVRGIAAGGMRPQEKERYGQRVVDHFSRQSHDPYEEAETFDDVRTGVELVRALVQMGRLEEAARIYRGALAGALIFNLEAHASILALLRPFFPRGWDSLPDRIDESDASYLANDAGLALLNTGEPKVALAAFAAALDVDLRSSRWTELTVQLGNISNTFIHLSRLAAVSRCRLLRLNLATVLNGKAALFRARLDYFHWLALVGRVADAENMWKLLDPMGRDWGWGMGPGWVEYRFARFRSEQGDLTDAHLARAETLSQQSDGRTERRFLHSLRGEWQLTRGNWALAAESFHDAVRMAREVGLRDPAAEVNLALANFHLGRLVDPRHEAEELSAAKDVSHLDLAALWLAIGDRERAAKHARDAYERAWADGEPYVYRYYLNQARTLLEQLGAEIPDLPPYDPAKDEQLPWEQDVADAIERLRKEKEAEASAKI